MNTDIQYKRFPEGLFITLEGMEACGKSTLAVTLAHWYGEQGYEVVRVHEPGGTEYGVKARELFLATHQDLVPEAEVGLLLTCKAQLLHTVIRPALKRGAVVICDRYTDTLFAYQHHAKGIDRDLICNMLDVFDCYWEPDFVLYLHVTLETSQKRTFIRKNAGGDFTSIDAAPSLFHQKVYIGMSDEINRHVPAMVGRVDGEQTMQEVATDAKRQLAARMEDLLQERQQIANAWDSGAVADAIDTADGALQRMATV